jgi:general secretion pathway protein B
MSILLDALKKSEEQRQFGKTPDIHGPDDHNPDGARRLLSNWLPGAMMAVAVIVITWLVWGQLREPDVTTLSLTPEVSRRSPAAMPDTARDEGQAAREQRTPVEAFTADSAGTDTALQTESVPDERRREVVQTFEQYQEAEPEEGAEPITDADPTRPGPTASPAGSERTVATGIRPVSNPTEPHESQPVTYWELPQNVRDAIPELQISVMVYADEPEDRFILVNGVRLKEKESLEGVQLEEIRRNGAIFRYRNYRFLVKG